LEQYSATSQPLVALERRRRDRELENAANAVRREANLPETIRLVVRDAHLTLEGEVEDATTRRRAEQVLSTVPQHLSANV
jgi:hypothetical protein